MRVRYFVNKEEGVVVCVGQNCTFDFLKDIEYFLSDGVSKELAPLPLCLSEEYRGIARLQDGDVWDEKFGKDLAYSKMITKYKKAKQKRLAKVIKAAEYSLNFLKNLSESYK